MEEINMSGGHYDYLCHRITEFAMLMNKDLSKSNIKKLKKEYKFSDKTIKNMIATEKLISQVGNLAYAVEWLMSYDTSQDDFNKEFDKIIGRMKNDKI